MAIYSNSPLRYAVTLLCIVAISYYIDMIINNHSNESLLLSQHDILIHDVINEQKHLYPYLAAVISITCLVGTIMAIICCS